MVIDNLAQMNRSSRTAIFAALIIIAAIAMYNWILAPHTTYLFAAQRYEYIVDDIAKRSRIIRSTIKIRERKLQELREQLAKLQNTLFGHDKAKEFFSDLQAISEQAGCTVYSLNFTESKRRQSEDKSGIVAKSVVLNVIGAYGDIIKLIESLQARTQKVWINSVSMESLKNDSAQLKCGITITIYEIQDKETTL